MRFLQPPCLSGAAAMIIRGASLVVSAVPMFKWGGGDQVAVPGHVRGGGRKGPAWWSLSRESGS